MNMNWIQFIIIMVGLAGLYWYQHFRIKQLEGKTKDQSELLQGIKTYFDIINPDLMKFRVELFERTLEKEKKIEIDHIRMQLETIIEAQRGEIGYADEWVIALISIINNAFIFVPHEIRKLLVAKSKSENVRQALEEGLSMYQEFDKQLRC